jgi:multimeric flavodoxin WrbA
LRELNLKLSDGDKEPKSVPSDVGRLVKILEDHDAIVFGTPTYWFNMSALMKNLFERLIVVEGLLDWPLENKVAGFVAVGDAKEDGAMIALATMAATANHLGMLIPPYGMLYVRGQNYGELSADAFARSLFKTTQAQQATRS